MLMNYITGSCNSLKSFVVLMVLFCHIGYAKTIIIQDLADREVQISLPVERIFIANSNYLQILDLVSGDSYFNKIAGWDDTIQQFFPDLAEAYFSRYPSLKNIPTIGKNSTIDVESIIGLKPDIVIASHQRYGYFQSQGMIKQLEASGINVVFIDFYSKPTEDTIKSITVLGKLLDNDERAGAFTDWYSKKIHFIEDKIKQIDNKPSVLLERNAGVMGKEGHCCNYYGSGSKGKFITLAGGNNLLSGI